MPVILLIALIVSGGCASTARPHSSTGGRPPTGANASLRPIATPGPALGVRAEWHRATRVLVHSPGDELLLGVLHPAAALFERAFDPARARQEHRAYVHLLREEGILVHQLTDVLLEGTTSDEGEVLEGPATEALRALALEFVTVEGGSGSAAERAGYVAESIRALPPADLVRTILARPTIRLQATGHNTGLAATYEVAPLMNLYFLRDQLITTANSVVLGRMNSTQRRMETRIIEFALGKLQVPIAYRVTAPGFLEGGDFIPAGEAVFIGQGLRTNAAAIEQLLTNDVFGVETVYVVKDPWKNMDQMHLDTYLNIFAKGQAVLEASRFAGQPNSPQVDTYRRAGTRYERIAQDVHLSELLGTLGYRVLAVSMDDQLKYGINFLTVREGRIFAVDGVSQAYKVALKERGVQATWMDFRHLTGGYGAAHCTTQVLARTAGN